MHLRGPKPTLVHVLAFLAWTSVSAPALADSQDGDYARGLCSQRSGGDNDRMWECCGEEVETIGEPDRARELGICRSGYTRPAPKSLSANCPDSSDPSNPDSKKSKMIVKRPRNCPPAAMSAGTNAGPRPPAVPTQPATANTPKAAMQGPSPITQDPKDPRKMLVDCSTAKGKQMFDMMSRSPGMMPGGVTVECKVAP